MNSFCDTLAAPFERSLCHFVMGRRLLAWYKDRYPASAAARAPCTGDPLPGWEDKWPSITADLADYLVCRRAVYSKDLNNKSLYTIA